MSREQDHSASNTGRHERAKDMVLRDLVNALVQENLLGLLERGTLGEELPEDLAAAMEAGPNDFCLAEGEQYFWLNLGTGGTLAMRVRPHRFLQPYKLGRLPVLLVQGETVQQLDPISFMQKVAELVNEHERGVLLPNLDDFVQELQDSVEHTALSLEAGERFARTETGTLLHMEQLSALRDRPFHPTARAKRGFSSAEYRSYSSEFGKTFALAWLALRRDFVKHGDLSAREIADSVLNEPEKRQLQTAMAQKGLSTETYLAIPVHPWQREHILPQLFAEELARGILVDLHLQIGGYTATSSLRALSREEGGNLHVKVPIGIYSLAALRILPLRYLSNAEQAQGVLQKVIDTDRRLSGRLHLCDESQWWGFHDPDGDFYGDKPGHLACLIRQYPKHLLEDASLDLLSMSSLSVLDQRGRMPAFEKVLVARGDCTLGAPLKLFRDIAEVFLATVATCFRYGMMPEVHGQNVVLTFRAGQVEGMLLRDHDTIRLYLPWLEREGFQDPGYVVKPGTPNSLINPTPEALLSYFQTLGLQVNLYAIAEAISHAYDVEEGELWGAMREAVEVCLREEELPADVRDVLRETLLQKATWPTRTLITPLLQRRGSGGGSMPAGVGVTANPLRKQRTSTADARVWAEQAAVERLLNAYLRETEVSNPAVTLLAAKGKPHLSELQQELGAQARNGAEVLHLALPNTTVTLWGVLAYKSPFGHHRYGQKFWLEQKDATLRRLENALELADVLLNELAAGDDDVVRGKQHAQTMRGNIANSIEKTALYLTRRASTTASHDSLLSRQGVERLAAAEQSLLMGHPFHPTPKSSEGFSAEDLQAFAPELEATFQLHYFAVAPQLVQEAFLQQEDGEIIPDAVQKAAQDRLSSTQQDYRLLPCHPWQANYLRGVAQVKELMQQDLLVDLGALGNSVYPTSSVRTVWDPHHGSFFKLPLNVRITHFVRVNPLDQLERTLDASRVLQQIAPRLPFSEFRIVQEAGYRTLRLANATPDVQEQLAASFGVIFRENLAQNPVRHEAPLVVASLLEQHPWADVPPLLEAVRTAAQVQGVTPDADFLKKWLSRYLAISLRPLLWLFTQYGVSLEAHVQNSMVSLEHGWPTQFCVRDLEGVSISRTHAELLAIAPQSPVLSSEQEAWQRLQYYFFVNHLGHLIHTLGYHGGVDERELWQVVAEQLEADHPTTAHLLQKAGLPAKANLTSAFQKRGETPSYVLIPNLLLN